jgi:phosphatidylglycerophosphate synthase
VLGRAGTVPIGPAVRGIPVFVFVLADMLDGAMARERG